MISINGSNLADLGFVPRPRSVPRLGGERSALMPIPGAVGGIRVGGQVQPGTLSVDGYLDAPSHAELLQQIDALSALLQGEQVIRLSDMIDREWHGLLQQGPTTLQLYDPQWVQRAAQLHLEWSLPDPTAIAQAPSGAAGAASLDAVLDVGTAPSPLRVEVTNAAATAPITRIVVTTYQGESAVDVLQWDGELAAGGVWLLDDEGWEVSVDGVGALEGLTAESIYPEMGPRAERVVVAITGGPASRIAVSHYRRWL